MILEFSPDYDSFARAFLGFVHRAPMVPNDRSALKVVLPCIPDGDGLWLEFGVYMGQTLKLMASFRNNGSVYGFDSFRGLPEEWNYGNSNKSKYVRKGAFEIAAPPTMEESNIELRAGLFNESIPPFLDEPGIASEKLRLLHVDCDLYSSTKSVLYLLQDKLVPGVVIVFDEIINYPMWRKGEFLALWEMLRDNRHLALQLLGTSNRNVVMNPKTGRGNQACAIRLVCSNTNPVSSGNC